MKINISVKTNYKDLNPKKSFISKIGRAIIFPEYRTIFIKNTKRKIKEFFSKKIIKNYENGYFCLDDVMKRSIDKEYQKYKEIGIKKHIFLKNFKCYFPKILENISKTTNSYNWSIYLEFNKTSSNMEYIDYTRVFISSQDNPLLRGEILIKKEDFLSIIEKTGVPLRKGIFNILDNEILDNFKDHMNNCLMIIEDENLDSETGLPKIDNIYSKIKNFFNLDTAVSKSLWFVSPIFLISKDVSWKLTVNTLDNNSYLKSYFHEKVNAYINAGNSAFLESIYESIKNIDTNLIQNGDDISKIRNLLEHLNFKELDDEITDEKVVELFEVLKLMEY